MSESSRRSNAPILHYKAILEKSFAFSRTFDPRNLEYHWYPLWNQTLSDLVSRVPNLIIAPQYPLWFVPQGDEEIEDDGNSDDENDPEEVKASIRGSRTESTVLEGDDDDQVVADMSFASESTMPEKYAKSVIVDFAIINLGGVPLQQKQNTHYGGWRITRADVGLLVEVKRFASRSLTPASAELEKALELRISEAGDDLINQAAHLFLQDEGKDFVLAIAAAGNSSTHVHRTHHDHHSLLGLYWRSTKIYRDDVKETMIDIQELDPTYQVHARKDVRLEWSSLLRLDLAQSNDHLQTIYNSLTEYGVLQTPGDV